MWKLRKIPRFSGILTMEVFFIQRKAAKFAEINKSRRNQQNLMKTPNKLTKFRNLANSVKVHETYNFHQSPQNPLIPLFCSTSPFKSQFISVEFESTSLTNVTSTLQVLSGVKIYVGRNTQTILSELPSKVDVT